MSLYAIRRETAVRTLAVLIGLGLLASVAIVGVADARASGEENTSATDGQTLTLVGVADETHYEFAVDGSVAANSTTNATVENDTHASGTLEAGDEDTYRVDGDVTSMTIAGNASVLLEDQRVKPGTLASEWAVTFPDCSTAQVAGDYRTGFVFSTVLFAVEGPDGELLGYEENPINERVEVRDGAVDLRAGSTLPENVSESTAVRSVYLYDDSVEDVDRLLVESEVENLRGEPVLRVDNPAYDACVDELTNEAGDSTTEFDSSTMTTETASTDETTTETMSTDETTTTETNGTCAG